MQRMAAKEKRLLMCSVCIRTALIWLLKTYFYAIHLAFAICMSIMCHGSAWFQILFPRTQALF